MSTQPNLSPHAKPRAKALQPLGRRPRHRRRRRLHHLCDLLQQQRPIERVDLSILPIPQPAIVEFVRVVGFHEGDGLLELVEILLEDGVLERGDKVGEEVYVDAQCGDAVGVDFGDGGGEGEGLWRFDWVSFGLG
jgi:hypothetical protein